MASLGSEAKKSGNERVDALDAAIKACRLNGAQITPLREAALSALYSAGSPLGAYDLKAQLSEVLGRPISATTVYRTLDFLCEQGVAARIESRNAYVPCAYLEKGHACIIFICDVCGVSSEVENKKLERLLAADAKELGFAVNHRVIELSGSCSDCLVSAS